MWLVSVSVSGAVLCCCAGIGAAVLLADLVYDVPANVILDSARRALSGYDVITSCIKAWVFGLIISTVRAHTGGMQLLPLRPCPDQRTATVA